MTCHTFQWNYDLECRPSAGARVDRERPAQTGRPLSHSNQPEPLVVSTGGTDTGIEASHVVCNRADERVRVAHQVDKGLSGLSVFDHIRQRLLHDTVHRSFDRARKALAD